MVSTHENRLTIRMNVVFAGGTTVAVLTTDGVTTAWLTEYPLLFSFCFKDRFRKFGRFSNDEWKRPRSVSRARITKDENPRSVYYDQEN